MQLVEEVEVVEVAAAVTASVSVLATRGGADTTRTVASLWRTRLRARKLRNLRPPTSGAAASVAASFSSTAGRALTTTTAVNQFVRRRCEVTFAETGLEIVIKLL